MKLRIKLSLISILFFFTIMVTTLLGCNEAEPKFAGLWAIDSFVYDSTEYMDCFIINTLNLTEDNKCEFPKSNKTCLEYQWDIEPNNESKWSIKKQKEKPVLIIHSNNTLFSGTYYFKLETEKESNVIVLFNDRKLIKLTKFPYF